MRFLTISFYSGIVLLILCILVLVSPLRDRFSNATQKIQGFGLNLEVSVLTLLVLISVALMSTGIWMQLQDVSTQVRTLTEQKLNAELALQSTRDQLDNAKRIPLTVYASLEGVEDTSRLDVEALTCTYSDGPGPDKKAEVKRASGAHPKRIKILFTDVQGATIIESLTISDAQAKQQWGIREIFKPLQPTLDLSRN